MLFGAGASGSFDLSRARSRSWLVVDNHHGFRPADIRVRTHRHTAPHASCRRVPQCSRGRWYAGGRTPVPKPPTPGSYLIHRQKTFGGSHMMVRFMRLLGGLVVNHPWLVTAISLVVTLLLYANIHNLRTGTDLTDLFGDRDPQWRAASQIGKELGYGNQLFVLIEVPATNAPTGATDLTGQMEEMADRLTADMQASGLFLDARCSLQDEELL